LEKTLSCRAGQFLLRSLHPTLGFKLSAPVQEMAGKIADWASQSQLIVFDSYHVTSKLLAAVSAVCPDAIIILFEDHQVPALLTSNPATS
jgi:hypothetical protein